MSGPCLTLGAFSFPVQSSALLHATQLPVWVWGSAEAGNLVWRRRLSTEEPGALLGSSKVCFAGRGGYRGVKRFWLPLCVWRVLSLESEPGESELLPESRPGWVGGCPSNVTGAGKALVNRDQLEPLEGHQDLIQTSELSFLSDQSLLILSVNTVKILFKKAMPEGIKEVGPVCALTGAM